MRSWMLTDWVLIARLAAELDDRLRGARVRAAGSGHDGEITLVLHSRGAPLTLAIDPFSSPPTVTLEPGGGEVVAGGGFARALDDSLSGMAVLSVSARRHDRLLRLVFGARSKFGVADELTLYVELVPRFGNIVLAKRDRVVAALKEFSPADAGRRSVIAGQAYALPPLPQHPRTVGRAPEVDAVRSDSPLHVYRRDGRIAQAYVAPLADVEHDDHSIETSLLHVFAQLRAQQRSTDLSRGAERRREQLLRRLNDRERKIRAELASLESRRGSAQRRDALRQEGEQIFATLHERTPEERDALKDRAAALFAQYRKASKSVPHIQDRIRALETLLQTVETLRWEAERAAHESLADVEDAAAQLEPRRKPHSPSTLPRKRKRATLEFRTIHGSRILVGRSPLDNAEVTFRLARPDDLWFHARAIPGAHVVLARDDRSEAPPDDITAAAELAALHSRAKDSAVVLVDYTQRKNVRKQRSAPPGLVWYTHAQTIAVTPKAFG
ncbi:MAG: DUF814 domain-containing protein [Candidatus Eremiobacteraeota bacterium]|nr:DUF814 domain-containing protein [Candidatus Eremiobacteraeota bacterium]